MSHPVRALVAPLKYPGSSPSNHMAANNCYSSSRTPQHASRYTTSLFSGTPSSRMQRSSSPWFSGVVETTVPSMQHRRPLFLTPRWTLLRKDFLDSRGRFFESQPTWGHVATGKFWPVESVQAKLRRDGLAALQDSVQAAFRAAPAGSSWGLPAFEQWWRAGTLSPARLRAGAAISMATAASGPFAGGSPRDILWRVS